MVIEPAKRRVTHLVVEPHRLDGGARLVPIELAGPENGRGAAVLLRCTVEDAGRLPPVQEFAYLRLGESPANDPDWDVGIENVLTLPHSRGYAGFGAEPMDFEANLSMTYDRIPKGEVEIRRASEVVSFDGHRVGHVDGFLVDGASPIASTTDTDGDGKSAVDFDPHGARYVALRWTPADAKGPRGFEVAEVSAFGEMPLSMLSTQELPDVYADNFIGLKSPPLVVQAPVLPVVSQ